MLRIRVVLPQPLGPSRPTTCAARGPSSDEVGQDGAAAAHDAQPADAIAGLTVCFSSCDENTRPASAAASGAPAARAASAGHAWGGQRPGQVALERRGHEGDHDVGPRREASGSSRTT